MSLLDTFPSRVSFTTKSSHTYSCVQTRPRNPKHPTLLFLHGFPSHVPDWIHQITHFSNQDYGILAPDLLGYGQSSKPSDPHAYQPKAMSDELDELLHHFEIDSIVGIGHDVGSTLLSRFAASHPNRVAACVFLAVGPPRLGTPFNVDAINAMTKEQMGYEMLGYIPFVSRDSNAQTVMEKNATSVMSLLFAANESTDWPMRFRPSNTFKDFMTSGAEVDVAPWYTTELQRAHLQAFAKQGGYAGAKGWYSMWDQELFMLDEKGHEDTTIVVPSLFIGPEGESEMQVGFLKEWVDDLDIRPVKSGHWVHIEQAEVVNNLIAEFLQKHEL